MKQVLATAALIALSLVVCAAGAPAPTDRRLVEAQKAFEEGERLKEAGQYAEAAARAEHALKLREAVLPRVHPQVADCLGLLAEIYRYQSDFERAEPLYERALEIQEATLGGTHLAVATTLHHQGLLYFAQGRFGSSGKLMLRALKIREERLGLKHPTIANSLHGLGILAYSQGDYANAEPLLEFSRKISVESLGEHDPQVAHTLNGLAQVYLAQGLYARAEPLLVQALEIRKRAFGEKHPWFAFSLNDLGFLHHSQGQYARAESLYARALELREATLGANHPHVAISLHGLASVHHSQGNHARAEPLYLRALQIQEATLGKSHPDLAHPLNNLANLYQAQELYARAEPLLTRALELRRGALGESNPDVARSLVNLAALYADQGHHARAEPLLARGLQILESNLGKNHPHVALSLSNLAAVHLGQHRLEKALPFLQRAFTTSEQHLRQEIFGLSEQRLAAFLERLRVEEEELYTLVRARPKDPRVLRLGLSAALIRKGRSLQEISNTSAIIYRSLGGTDRQRFERLRELRTRLAALSLEGPGLSPLADYQKHLADLAREGDELEADLARRSEPLRRLHDLPLPEQLLPRIAAALPADGALVEFVEYQDTRSVYRVDPVPTPEASHPRYLAFLLFPDQRIRAVDLGPAADVNRAALRLREALALREDDAPYLPAAQSLHALAIHPLAPHLGGVRRLFLSADGQLNLIPFAALYDGSRFLIDSFHITYLTSGKDLLSRSEGRPAATSVVVLADPAFGATSLPGRLTKDVPVTGLKGTRREADAIHELFPQARMLRGSKATKQALLELSRPGLLHIATHGEFRDDAAPPPPSPPPGPSINRAPVTTGALGSFPKGRPADPLMRSYLVLAGGSRPGDAWVTALELAGLDLWGTQLVVLSACDTGLGEVKTGQGVYGLRRAFLTAGTQTLVTSLWKVDDAVTSELMTDYYRALLAGHPRTAALRDAMLKLRSQRPHPRFWASFIAFGLDVPLQGMPRRPGAPPSVPD